MVRIRQRREGVSAATFATAVLAIIMTCDRVTSLRMTINGNDRSVPSRVTKNDPRGISSDLILNDETPRIEKPFSTSKGVDKTQKKKVAPLVDSALLRFLASTQQSPPPKNPQYPSGTEEDSIFKPLSTDTIPLQTSDQRNISRPSIEKQQFFIIPSSSGSYLDSMSNFTAVAKTGADKILNGEETAVPSDTATQIDSQSLESSNTTKSKLSQFDADTVTKALVEAGADFPEARNAGWEIQRYMYDRSRGSAIRRFLRSRDSLWANNDNADARAVLGNDKVGEMAGPVNYANVNTDVRNIEENRFEAVMEVFLSAGLTGKDCAAILSHTPALVMMKGRQDSCGTMTSGIAGEEDPRYKLVTLEETVDRVLNRTLCGVLGLRKYDARKVLRLCPGLLTNRGSMSAEQVIDLLFSLGSSYTALAREKAAIPVLLARSPASLFRLVAFLSSDSIRMPVARIGPLLRKSDCSALLDAVAPITAQIHIDEIQRRKMIESAYRKMAKTANCLHWTLGIDNLPKIVAANPSVLLLDTSTQILPVAGFLVENVGVWEEDVPKILEAYPALLGASVPKMQKVVDYLTSFELDMLTMGKIVRAFPYVLTLDVDTRMIPVVEFLRGIGVVNIGRFITRLPPVLGYSVTEELIPKWKYLSQENEFDAYFEVVRFPAYFSYPLDKVIMTRYEYLRARGISWKAASVDDVLRFGNADFARKVAGDLDDGSLFARFVKERKKKYQQRTKRKTKTKTKSLVKRISHTSVGN